MTLNVIINGGGIGGLTAALACSKKGFSVSAHEQADGLFEVGAGLQISPNASRVLGDLGLVDELAKRSFTPKALEMRIGSTGRLIFSIPMGDTAIRRYGAPYYHIHRADLIEMLLSALEGYDQISLKTGSRAIGYRQAPDSITLIRENGDELATGDVLVGADGIKSVVRQQILGDTPAQFTRNVAWRAVARATPELRQLIPPVATVWTGDKRHAVTYYLRGGELINFVGVVEEDSWTDEGWSQPGDLQELASHFSAYSSPVRTLIDSLDQCFKWALHTRPPLARWSAGRVTLLGDAAHPMLPFQAQGAAQAIEDATVLARMLDGREDVSVESRLKTYQANRLPRASKIQSASHANMSVFHKGTGLNAALTYGPMAIAARAMPDFVASRQDWIYSFVA